MDEKGGWSQERLNVQKVRESRDRQGDTELAEIWRWDQGSFVEEEGGRKVIYSQEEWRNRDGYLLGVSEFQSERRKGNREEPQLIASH